MAEDERTNDDATAADRGGKLEGGANIEGGGAAASGAELRGGGDPASAGEGGQSHGEEGEAGTRRGDWDPGIIRGGGELY